MTPPREVEPTLAAMQTAAEQARAANHHAYHLVGGFVDHGERAADTVERVLAAGRAAS